MAEPAWSVVLTAYEGKPDPLRLAAEAAFQRPGFPAWTFASRREGPSHLPAEIAAGMVEEQARRAAGMLKAAGATVEIVATDTVSGVRHRAAEVWPTRWARGWCFSEIDDVVCMLSPLNGGENLRQMREQDPNRERWHLERGLNHQHPSPSLCASRAGLRLCADLAAETGAALREAYPERRFVVCTILGGDLVSFYQAVDGAPEEPAIGEKKPSRSPWIRDLARSWCTDCGGGQEYDRRPEPDTEFPMVDWGTCRECGGEMVLSDCECRFLVGPGVAQEFRVGAYTARLDEPVMQVMERTPLGMAERNG